MNRRRQVSRFTDVYLFALFLVSRVGKNPKGFEIIDFSGLLVLAIDVALGSPDVM